MELELLKEIWKETEKPQATFANADIVGVNKTTLSTQQKLISTLKRNLFAEVIIVLICVCAIAVFYFTAFNGNFSEVSWMYIILAILFLGYYYKKNQLLKSIQANSLNVKANLQFRITAFEKYIRFYLVTGTLLVPLLLTFFYFLLFHKHIHVFPALQNHIGSEKFIILYIMFSIFFTIALYYLYRWYIYSLYGKHIAQLKALLTEMDVENVKET